MRRIVLAAGALLLAACTASADLKQALQVTDVTTGWFDAGNVDGKNKLVPSISFRLKNGSDAEISTAALNIVFRFVDTGEEQDNIFVQRVQFNGRQTDVMTIRSQTG